MLESGYHDVPEGHTASVVTYLEMHGLPALRAVPEVELTLERVTAPDLARYRALFRAVGGEYLWDARLQLDDAALKAILTDAQVHLYIARKGAADAGLLELDFRAAGQCELAYFGLAPDYVGGGAGRWLMTHALTKAWAQNITRLFVHTCTLDHPNALAFYIRSGFRPYKRCVEISPDPRPTGRLPESAAPQIPRL
jgi:GNAT superfamily N-acetyltransferase